MKIQEVQTYWSDVKKDVIVKERTLDAVFLGEKNGFKFYKISPQLPEFLGGEILLNNCKQMTYSKEIKTENKEGIIHSNLACIGSKTWRGTSIKTNNAENNGIEIKFL